MENDREFFAGLLDDISSMSTVTSVEVLPTKGKLDGNAIPDGKVTLRMMTAHEEKIRTGSSGVSFWKVMSNIINRCIIEPKNIDTYNLTVIDFIFLMYRLRRLSLGKDYKVNLSSCPHCKKPLTDVSINLDELEVIYLPDDFKEPFRVNLPKLKWGVDCRLLRVREFDEITDKADKILKEFPDYEGDPQFSLRLKKQIVAINDHRLDDIQLEQIVDKLPYEDELAISNAFDNIDAGLNTDAKYICPRCGKVIEIPLSYTEEFFRPTRSYQWG